MTAAVVERVLLDLLIFIGWTSALLLAAWALVEILLGVYRLATQHGAPLITREILALRVRMIQRRARPTRRRHEMEKL